MRIRLPDLGSVGQDNRPPLLVILITALENPKALSGKFRRAGWVSFVVVIVIAFLIAVTIQCCPNAAITPSTGTGAGMLRTDLTTIAVPPNATVEYSAGSVSGSVRARISQSVIGGTVSVVAVRLEEQQGWSRRAS
jgi:hypothetical protein